MGSLLLFFKMPLVKCARPSSNNKWSYEIGTLSFLEQHTAVVQETLSLSICFKNMASLSL